MCVCSVSPVGRVVYGVYWSKVEQVLASNSNSLPILSDERGKPVRYRRGVMNWVNDGICNVANEIPGGGREQAPISPDPR